MSDDDAILKKLGARVREERAEAEPEGVPPFDAAFADRITAKLLAGSAEARAVPPGRSVARSAARNATVARPARFRWAYAPLSVAAAALLWFGTRGPASSGDLPTFELSAVSVKEQRSAPEPVAATDIALDAEGDFEILARPKVASSEPLAVRGYLVRDGAVSPWTPTFAFSEEGTVRASGRVRDHFPETGVKADYEIVLLVARRGALPEDARSSRIVIGTESAPSGLRVVRGHVHFVAK